MYKIYITKRNAPQILIATHNSMTKLRNKDHMVIKWFTKIIHHAESLCSLTIWALSCQNLFYAIWAATWQNQQNGCAPSEDTDQPGHLPSLIRVFAVRMKKGWVLSYPISAERRLIRLGGCPGWSESSLAAHSFHWFCHVSAHMWTTKAQINFCIGAV